MKRGNLRTVKDYTLNCYVIQGRKNGRWVNAWDEEREKRGLSKHLYFHLEYDACGYLQGLLDWIGEQKIVKNAMAQTSIPKDKVKFVHKTRRKMINKSKRQNRRKK